MFTRKVTEVATELICPNPDQPRKNFKEEELEELTSSIKEYGVLQPIILKKDKYGLYIIIAGERRYRAAVKAGLSRIPAIVKNADEKDSAVIALVENVQRENLNFMEEAYAYKRLMEEYRFTQNDIAQKVGKQQSTISNKMRLLTLPDEIQKIVFENRLTERHARALLKLSSKEVMEKVLERVVEEELNVKQTEKLVEECLLVEEEEKRKKTKVKYINYKIYVNSIRKVFGEIVTMEKGAKFYQEDKGDLIEVKILIPKKPQKKENKIFNAPMSEKPS